MRAGKRGVLEILASLLNALAQSPLKKTHLTYKVNLDSRTAAKYMAILLELELVDKSEDDPSYYIITRKGRHFLEQYKPMRTL